MIPVDVPSASPSAVPSAVSSAPVLTESSPTPAGVLTGRARIDDLDRRILELVAERREVSLSVGAARLAEGGRRLDLKRETEIISRYSSVLGKPGTTIAMQVLELCRGKI